MPKKLNRERTEFGERLYEARKAAGLTQTQLAKAAGMSQGTYAELEYAGGASTYTAQLAAALKVRGEWLANGTGPMRDPQQALSPEAYQLAQEFDSFDAEAKRTILTIWRQLISMARAKEDGNGDRKVG